MYCSMHSYSDFKHLIYHCLHYWNIVFYLGKQNRCIFQATKTTMTIYVSIVQKFNFGHEHGNGCSKEEVHLFDRQISVETVRCPLKWPKHCFSNQYDGSSINLANLKTFTTRLIWLDVILFLHHWLLVCILPVTTDGAWRDIDVHYGKLKVAEIYHTLTHHFNLVIWSLIFWYGFGFLIATQFFFRTPWFSETTFWLIKKEE